MVIPWDRAYCINLNRRPDRWEHARREFEKVDITVQRFGAIDWKAMHPRMASELTKKVPQDQNLLGHVACGISHRQVMASAIASSLESVAIFEDDITLSRSFWPMLKEAMKDIPKDWQFLYLGCRPKKTDNAVEYVTRALARVNACYDAHAYVLREPLLSNIRRDWDPFKLTTDWYFELIKPRYAVCPWVAWQDKELESEMVPRVGTLL